MTGAKRNLDFKEEIKSIKVTRKKMDGYRMFKINKDEGKHWDIVTIIKNGLVVCTLKIGEDGTIYFERIGKDVSIIPM